MNDLEGAVSSRNATVVKGFFEAVYTGDFDEAFGRFALPEFTWIVSSADNPDLQRLIPWAGRRLIGKAGYIELATSLFDEFEPLVFEPRRYIEAESMVFVEGHFTFRHRSTGKIADSDWLARFDMKDGRIAGGQFYENTASVAAARKQ